jgi:hypothetical protein
VGLLSLEMVELMLGSDGGVVCVVTVLLVELFFLEFRTKKAPARKIMATKSIK